MSLDARSSLSCTALATVAGLLTATVTSTAHAQAPTAARPVDRGSPSSVDDGASRPAPHERRNGVVVGAAAGVAFGGASGYPNDVKLLGDPDFRSASPLLVGYSTSLFLLGALSDYVSFGPMFTTANFESPSWRSTGYGLGFRGEVFPLVSLVPALADTAVFAQAGFGITELRAKGPYPSAEGAQTFLGLGVHHELRLARLLGGHAAVGPELEWSVIDSQTAQRHWVTLGLRLSWYGGRVGLDREGAP